MDADVMHAKLIKNPSWMDGPWICDAVRLPAFETFAEAMAFHEANNPSGQITEIFQCPHCDWWHYHGRVPSPSGDSSGSSRR